MENIQERNYCRNCAGIRIHKTLFEAKKSATTEDYISFHDRYKIIECCGCETISFLHIYEDETMWRNSEINGDVEYYDERTVYPPYIIGCRIVSNTKHLPPIILNIYEETLVALQSKCFLLAGGGFRAVIEAICKNLKVDKPTLGQKIDELNTLGHLTKNETKRLHSVRFLGNDSLHEMQKPNENQLILILDIVNHLLDNLYIQDKIIEGNLDVKIVDFESFIVHLNNILSKEEIHTTKTLLEFLGKSKRLLNISDIKLFEVQLNNQINEGVYSYLNIIDNTVIGKTVYEVIRIPVKPDLFDNF